MRLQAFRIRNYKSIVDSGICRLSDNDNILVLAGQNESGKSSVLQALYDFDRAEMREDAVSMTDNKPKYPIIECTYAVEADDNLLNYINEEITDLPDRYHYLFTDLKEITLIRSFTSEEDSELSFDEELTKNFDDERLASTQPAPSTPVATEEAVPAPSPSEPDIDISEVARAIWSYTPKVIFFDDFCDLLPDKILISDLKTKNTAVKGYNAVKNIETVLGADLTHLDSLTDAASASKQDKLSKTVTANFNERWKQRIFDKNEYTIEIRYMQGKGATPAPYLNFFVLTKEGEYLTPAQRSMGLRWFLSFYLELKAKSMGTIGKLIILFDEPGLYLHSKAQNDIKNLFEELGVKDQILYSTHSPYLIDTAKLNRIRLIINNETDGTTIEKITTKKVSKQRDALKPIIDAMGLEIAHNFSPVQKRNVIVEGISDFNYFMAMKKLLGYEGDDYSFVPSMGAPNVHLLMELCIGWGLEWLMVLDDESQSQAAYRKIRDSFFDGKDKDTQEHIHIIQGEEAIEELFNASDLKLAKSDAEFPAGKKKSEKVKEYGGKELFSRIFLEKVNNGEITKDKLGATTVKKFEAIFAFIRKKYGIA